MTINFFNFDHGGQLGFLEGTNKPETTTSVLIYPKLAIAVVRGRISPRDRPHWSLMIEIWFSSF